MATMPAETEAAMGAMMSDPVLVEKDALEQDAIFVEFDANKDGMVSKEEFLAMSYAEHDRAATKFPAGYMDKPSAEHLNNWYTALLTLDDKPEVTLDAVKKSRTIWMACYMKLQAWALSI